jgi:hypothetical protein
MRTAIEPGFTDRVLRAQEELLVSYADQMIWRILENAKDNAKVNLVEIFNMATFGTTAELVCGESLNMLGENKYNWWVAFIFDNVKFAAWGGVISRFIPDWLLSYADKALKWPVKAKLGLHWNYSAAMVDKRMARGAGTKPDIWSFVEKFGEKGNLSRLDMCKSQLHELSL